MEKLLSVISYGKKIQCIFYLHFLVPVLRVHSLSPSNFGVVLLDLMNDLINADCPQHRHFVSDESLIIPLTGIQM